MEREEWRKESRTDERVIELSWQGRGKRKRVKSS